jgi:hypothetical protein
LDLETHEEYASALIDLVISSAALVFGVHDALLKTWKLAFDRISRTQLQMVLRGDGLDHRCVARPILLFFGSYVHDSALTRM